jgi:hypothetical protein
MGSTRSDCRMPPSRNVGSRGMGGDLVLVHETSTRHPSMSRLTGHHQGSHQVNSDATPVYKNHTYKINRMNHEAHCDAGVGASRRWTSHCACARGTTVARISDCPCLWPARRPVAVHRTYLTSHRGAHRTRPPGANPTRPTAHRPHRRSRIRDLPEYKPDVAPRGDFGFRIWHFMRGL